MKVLFVSNLFPDSKEADRGQVNATALHALAEYCEIRVLALRPALPLAHVLAGGNRFEARPQDRCFHPTYLETRYIPKIGGGVNHKLMASFLRSAIQIIRDTFKFDIVLCAWVYPDGCAIAELAKELNFPFVLIAQGSDVHEYLVMPLRRRVITEALQASPATIARSAELARLIESVGVPANRIAIIYNGVNLSLFNPANQTDARRQLGLPTDARIVLYVGSLLAIKNPGYLLEAFAKMKSLRPGSEYRLIYVGEGSLLDSLQARAQTLGVALDIAFVGKKVPQTVAQYMQAADVLCVSSDNEGMPNVIYESFACGLPVVATRVGGIPEVVREPFLGRLVERNEPESFAKAMIDVLDGPKNSQLIVEYVSQYSWKETAAKYYKLLKEVCERHHAA